ncbi:hypothetical protein WLF18_01240 [Pseudomonas shirazensis]|uniref:Uncharacterized protein n=1 Tax=Pseudomonas shirazensis TaxID=2745494 RepID=A0ABU8ZUX1_9PSED
MEISDPIPGGFAISQMSEAPGQAVQLIASISSIATNPEQVVALDVSSIVTARATKSSPTVLWRDDDFYSDPYAIFCLKIDIELHSVALKMRWGPMNKRGMDGWEDY